MSAFIVLLGSGEKYDGPLGPTILGPFGGDDAAHEWLYEGGQTEGYPHYRPEVLDWWQGQCDMYGGYPTAIIVSSESCEDSPEDWLQATREFMCEMGEEGDPCICGAHI